jgi:hypothetical protein
LTSHHITGFGTIFSDAYSIGEYAERQNSSNEQVVCAASGYAVPKWINIYHDKSIVYKALDLSHDLGELPLPVLGTSPVPDEPYE